VDRWGRWVVAAIAAIAIVALVAFARGGAERGNPDASPSPAAMSVSVVV
jgi:hypothetical protein